MKNSFVNWVLEKATEPSDSNGFNAEAMTKLIIVAEGKVPPTSKPAIHKMVKSLLKAKKRAQLDFDEKIALLERLNKCIEPEVARLNIRSRVGTIWMRKILTYLEITKEKMRVNLSKLGTEPTLQPLELAENFFKATCWQKSTMFEGERVEASLCF
jgi:DNA polymerase III psi subunit